MKINLTIPDELFERFVVKWGVPGLYYKIREAAEAIEHVEKNDRYFVVCGDNRRAIEAIFQTTIDNGDKLFKLIRNLNVVKLGDINIDFTPDELARLDMQAAFHGRDRATFIQEMIAEIKDRMLERV